MIFIRITYLLRFIVSEVHFYFVFIFIYVEFYCKLNAFIKLITYYISDKHAISKVKKNLGAGTNIN